MGTIEDVRKVMQDFLAPELGALKAEIAAVRDQAADYHAQALRDNANVVQSVEALKKSMEQRFVEIINYTDLLKDNALTKQRVEALEKQAR